MVRPKIDPSQYASVSLVSCVRITYELRRLEYVLTTGLITPLSVICDGNCDFFFFSRDKLEVVSLEG